MPSKLKTFQIFLKYELIILKLMPSNKWTNGIEKEIHNKEIIVFLMYFEISQTANDTKYDMTIWTEQHKKMTKPM